MPFNPVADSLGKLIEPLATEVREFGQTLLETLQGITAEQRRTNELLTELRGRFDRTEDLILRTAEASAGIRPRGPRTIKSAKGES